MNKTLLVLLLFIGVLQGCNSSRSLSKKAAKLEQAGMYTDAAVFYFNSLQKNPNNIDARIGLKTNGQKLLNDKVDAFTKVNAQGQTREAVYTYLQAQEYADRVNRLGVSLEIPQYIRDDYAQAKAAYLDQLYTDGNNLMAAKNFREANQRFSEITKLAPDYKETASLKNISRNEPLYLQAVELHQNRNYRGAYNLFQDILAVDPQYKDCAEMRDDCLRKGVYTVAVLPFENNTSGRGLEHQVGAYAISSLTALNDPFLKIIEEQNSDLIREQQRQSLNGLINESTAAELGNLLGAKAILTGKILSYSRKPGSMRTIKKDGYEAYTKEVYNATTEQMQEVTKYKPVTYYEHINENEVTISFQYNLISLETGEVLLSKVENYTADDQIYYATYEGEATLLYPSAEKAVNTNLRDRKILMQLIRADRSLKSLESLTTQALQETSRSMAREIHQFLNR